MSQETYINELEVVLANTYVLYTKTQNFHWNVTGPHFSVLHTLFEGQYNELFGAIDEIAERIRMRGSEAPGSLKRFLETTTLKESAEDLGPDTMLDTLIHDHQVVHDQIAKTRKLAADQNDSAGEDLLTQRLAAHEKAIWMLKSTATLPQTV